MARMPGRVYVARPSRRLFVLGAASLVEATVASAKQIHPKVALVIDSVCEEGIAVEIAGPVRLLADRDHLVIRRVTRPRQSMS